MEPKNKTSNIVIEAESAKINTSEKTKEQPLSYFQAPTPDKTPDAPEKPSDAKETQVGLMSVKSDNYTAWVIRVSEATYQAHLTLSQGSAYHWDASLPEEAETILNYHIVNMKL